MARLLVHHDGGPLTGTLRLDGAKHAFAHSLACAAAADDIELHRVPAHLDAAALISTLELMFDEVRHDFSTGLLIARAPRRRPVITVDAALAARSRSIFGLLPALLHRAGQVVVEAPPAGCAIGRRPWNWYIETLSWFGVRHAEDAGRLVLSWPERRPAEVRFAYPSMTGTVVAVAAAALTPGTSLVVNGSVEPSVSEQTRCLTAMGGDVRGGTPTVEITGALAYDRCRWSVAPDRIHAVTYLTAGLLSRGEVTVEADQDIKIPQFIRFLEAAGADVRNTGKSVSAGLPSGDGELAPVDLSVGSEPAFSSDWGAFAMLLLAARSHGLSRLVDDVFLDRFQFARSLEPYGLLSPVLHRIKHRGRAATEAVVTGRPRLHLRGGTVRHCPDIRGSAALLLAGLLADGPWILDDDYQVRRGYAAIQNDLRQLGVRRVVRSEASGRSS